MRISLADHRTVEVSDSDPTLPATRLVGGTSWFWREVVDMIHPGPWQGPFQDIHAAGEAARAGERPQLVAHIHRVWYAWLTAEACWVEQLVLAFGQDGRRHQRYTHEGNGAPNTALRLWYDEHARLRLEWVAATDALKDFDAKAA